MCQLHTVEKYDSLIQLSGLSREEQELIAEAFIKRRGRLLEGEKRTTKIGI